MKLSWFILCVLISFGLSLGQLLFKKTALTMEDSNNLLVLIKSSLLNVWLLSALLLYGIITIAWVFLLRTVPLGLAYPVLSLSFLIVPFASHFIFGDPLNWRIFLSGIFICIGISITGYGIR